VQSTAKIIETGVRELAETLKLGIILTLSLVFQVVRFY
jgi:hypothetical protein